VVGRIVTGGAKKKKLLFSRVMLRGTRIWRFLNIEKDREGVALASIKTKRRRKEGFDDIKTFWRLERGTISNRTEVRGKRACDEGTAKLR